MTATITVDDNYVRVHVLKMVDKYLIECTRLPTTVIGV